MTDMKPQFAAHTSVSAEKSKMEIEKILARYGADQFIYGWKNDTAVVAFRMKDRHVRFDLPMPDPQKFQKNARGASRPKAVIEKAIEQAKRQRWRALTLMIKAKLESVASGITCFDREFLAYVVLPNNQTVGDATLPMIEQAYKTGKVTALLGHF